MLFFALYSDCTNCLYLFTLLLYITVYMTAYITVYTTSTLLFTLLFTLLLTLLFTELSDPCGNTPCHRNAPCTNLNANTGTYKCDCPAPFTSNNCDGEKWLKVWIYRRGTSPWYSLYSLCVDPNWY